MDLEEACYQLSAPIGKVGLASDHHSMLGSQSDVWSTWETQAEGGNGTIHARVIKCDKSLYGRSLMDGTSIRCGPRCNNDCVLFS